MLIFVHWEPFAALHTGHYRAMYTTPEKSVFRKMALALPIVTDKVTTHSYDALYSKYLESPHVRFARLKFLEIGLG